MSPCKLFRVTTLGLLAALQVLILCNAQSSESGIIFQECGNCPQGEVCAEREDGTKFCKKACTQNCTDVATEILCASNGKTYQNRCEMKKDACEQNRDLRVEYLGLCITIDLVPATAEPVVSCKAKQNDYLALESNYFERCHFFEVDEKGLNGLLELSDLRLHDDCHNPHCTGEDTFSARQCSEIARGWCWCSNPDGTPVENTLQQNLPQGECIQKTKCGSHSHGSVFPAPSGCGLCKCSNGVTTCYDHYEPNQNGTINETQLNTLRDEFMRLYYFQYNHNDSTLMVNLGHIYDHSLPAVPNALREKVLRWKFDHFDKNWDGKLSSPEQFNFEVETLHFIRCAVIFDQIVDLIDENDNDEIKKREWIEFFTQEPSESSADSSGSDVSSPSGAGVSKRSASNGVVQLGRKPLSLRKKFYYTFH